MATLTITNGGPNAAPQSDVLFADVATTSIAEQTIESTTNAQNAEILLQEGNTITIDNLTDDALTLGSNVSLTLQTRNDTLSGDTAAGGITFADTNDRIVASGTGSLLLDAGTNNGSVVNGTPNIVAGGLTTGSGNIRIIATNNITLTNSVSSANGAVSIQSQFGTIVNDEAVSTTSNVVFRTNQLDLTSGTITTSDSVNLRVNTGGVGIDLGSTSLTGGTLNLSDAEIDSITANNLRLTSANGISITAPITINPTKVPTLLFDGIGNTTQTAALSVQNLSIGISGTATLTNASNDFDSLAVTGASAVSIVDLDGITLGNATVTNLFSVTAGDSAATGDDLTINNNSTVQSTADNITLNAGDNFSLTSGSTVSALGTVTINIDPAATDADVGTGAILTIVGAVTSGSGTTLQGGNDADTFNIQSSITANANGGTGNDVFNFSNTGSLGTGTIDGAGGTADTLAGDADGNAFTITGANSGTLTGKTNSWSNIENLSGGAGADTYVLSGGSLSGTIQNFGAGGDTLSGNGAIAGELTVNSGGTVSPGVSSIATIDTGNFVLNSGATLTIELNGTANTADQINVTGTVNLGGATLNLTSTGTFTAGQIFTLISNDGTDAITGTFNGLAEGAQISGFGAGLVGVISYAGGTGNDAVVSITTIPTISIGDVSITEGNSGISNAIFTVSLSPSSGLSITTSFSTTDGSATSTSDYVSTSGSLTFTAGVTSQTITVPVNGDTIDEDNETFTVSLSGVSNATIGIGVGTATITNDDLPPTLSIENLSVTEGQTATFTASLSAISGKTIGANFGTTAGTAQSDLDFTNTEGTLTFNPGEQTKTFTVATLEDLISESTEGFTVSLSNPSNATIGSPGTASIVDNDPAEILVTPTSLTTTESGSAATFTVQLATIPTSSVTVNLSGLDTTEGSLSNTSLTFTDTTPQTIIVTGVNDSILDGNVTYTIGTSAISNDSIYNGINVPDVQVTNNDNETLNLTPSTNVTLTSFGPTATNNADVLLGVDFGNQTGNYPGDGNDRVDLREGNDFIFATGGNDSIFGNEGNDTIFGGKGNDTILGGNGNDSIYGGPSSGSLQRDVLTGGAGSDSFLVPDDYIDITPNVIDSFVTITDLAASGTFTDRVQLAKGQEYLIGRNSSGINVIFRDLNSNSSYQQGTDDTIAILSNQRHLPLGAISDSNPPIFINFI